MSFAPLYHVLPSKTYSAGATDVLECKTIPKTMQGRIVHVLGFIFDVTLTPTFASGSVTLNGEHQIFSKLDFFDGQISRFLGSLMDVRGKEIIQTGRTLLPDPDEGATTVARYWRRILWCGPSQFAGHPTDYAIPAGMLENAVFNITYGSLAEVSADISAATGSVRTTAILALFDEVRIPPAYQFIEQAAGSADVALMGRALYESVFVLDGASYAAITGGDFSTFRLDFGQGDYVAGVRAETLTAAWQASFRAGEFGTVGGEPTAGADDNGKIVNRSSPTAIVAQLQNMQPVLFSPLGAKISKLPAAESVTKLSWSGSATSAHLLIGRTLSQPSTVAAARAAAAVLPLRKSVKSMTPKTLSKKPYGGPYGEFMPWVVKVA
jgi:hypothetical protein